MRVISGELVLTGRTGSVVIEVGTTVQLSSSSSGASLGADGILDVGDARPFLQQPVASVHLLDFHLFDRHRQEQEDGERRDEVRVWCEGVGTSPYRLKVSWDADQRLSACRTVGFTIAGDEGGALLDRVASGVLNVAGGAAQGGQATIDFETGQVTGDATLSAGAIVGAAGPLTGPPARLVGFGEIELFDRRTRAEEGSRDRVWIAFENWTARSGTIQWGVNSGSRSTIAQIPLMIFGSTGAGQTTGWSLATGAFATDLQAASGSALMPAAQHTWGNVGAGPGGSPNGGLDRREWTGAANLTATSSALFAGLQGVRRRDLVSNANPGSAAKIRLAFSAPQSNAVLLDWEGLGVGNRSHALFLAGP